MSGYTKPQRVVNVHCAPHAARNCDGTYVDTTCSTGTSLPTLPSIASIECDKEHSLLPAANLAVCPTPCATYTESAPDLPNHLAAVSSVFCSTTFSSTMALFVIAF